MHIEKKPEKITVSNKDGIQRTTIEHASQELVLDEGDTVDNLTEEQKDALLAAAFLPNGDSPMPPAGPPTTYSPQEYKEISEDIARMSPKGPAAGSVMEMPMGVASRSLAGPPVVSPTESRVVETSVEGGRDNVPPARRR